MATKWNLSRDINGYNGFGLAMSDLNYSSAIAATTDTSIAIPDIMGMGGNGISSKSVWIAVINISAATGAVWMAVNATAAVPLGAGFAQTNSILLPPVGTTAIQIKGGDVLHFFSTLAGNSIGIRLYSLS